MVREKKTITIINSLKELMKSDSFKARHRKNPNSFVRKRVLGFSGMVIAQISRMVKSLSVELDELLQRLGGEESYSKQAFSKSRKNLAPSAFVELNARMLAEYYQEPVKLYAGTYRLLGVDGSNLQFYESEELERHFGSSSNKYGTFRPMGKASLLYDLLEEMVLDAQLAPYGSSERELFLQHLEQSTPLEAMRKEPVIYVGDRGYPSYGMLKKLGTRLYVFRCKESHNSSVKKFVRSGKSHGNVELHESWGRKGASITARIVRVPTNKGYCYLLTNTDLSAGQLAEIYQLRWGVETYYNYFKHSLQVENFTSKSVVGVEQDFHSAVLTANLAQLIINQANEELSLEQQEKNNKYSYKINKHVAIGILKKEIQPWLIEENLLSEEILIKLKKRIKRHTTEVKPGRSFPRQKENSRKRKKPRYVPNRKRSI